MVSHGPQQPRYKIFSWLRPSRGSWGPIINLVGNSNFFNFFTKPNNMGVYGLPWNSGAKIWHFWTDSDPPGCPRVPFQFFRASLQNLTIWVSVDSHGPPQPRFDFLTSLRPSRGCWGPISNFVGNSKSFSKTFSLSSTILVSIDSPGTLQPSTM